MVAVVTSGSNGLVNSSKELLGGAGELGNAATGRAGEQVTVNAADGSLIVQDRDEYLVGVGPDVNLLRTYNRNGIADGDNNDNWRIGYYRTIKTDGGVIRRIEADGSQSTYTYNGTRYVSTDGAGQYDSLTTDGTQWIWTDGDSGVKEYYDAAGSGNYRLARIEDPDGNAVKVSYIGDLISTLSTHKGASAAIETVALTYNGSQLSSVSTQYKDGAQIKTRGTTSYTYYPLDADASKKGKLWTITTDLTPEDGTDTKAYTVTYDYDSSGRLNSIRQTDGSSVSIDYHADGRVKSVLDGRGLGTTFTYDTVNRTTTVKDALNQATTLKYSASGELLEVAGAVTGGSGFVHKYTYNASGDLLTSTNGKNETTTYQYDSSTGALLRRTDHFGNVVERTYTAEGLLASETAYLNPDLDGVAGSGTPSAPRTTNYFYDTSGSSAVKRRLAYVLDPQGGVTRYIYNAFGQMERRVEYTGALFTAASPSFSSLETWVNGSQASSVERQVTDYTYNLRGQVEAEKRYATVTVSSGAIVLSGLSTTTYAYDPSGRLITQQDASGVKLTYEYDGLGRVTKTLDTNNVATIYSYSDAGLQTSVKLANGQTTVQTFNQWGELISSDVLGAGNSPTNLKKLGETQYGYDGLGRLWRTTDATGVKTFTLYDVSGRKSADIAANGQLTEYLYDAAGRLIQQVAYTTALSQAKLDALTATSKISDAGIRPTIAYSQDRITTYYYDTAGRLTGIQDADGYLTHTKYDGTGAVTSQTTYFKETVVTRLDAALGTTRATAPAQPSVTADAAKDRTVRNLYDAAGRLAARIDGDGGLTRWTYDASGNQRSQLRRSALLTDSERTTGTLTTLSALPLLADDEYTQWLYDGHGRRIAQLSAEGHLAEYTYDAAGRLKDTLQYLKRAFKSITVGSPNTLRELLRSELAGFATSLGSALKTTRSYNNLGLLERETGVDGTITEYKYDNLQRLERTTLAKDTTEQRVRLAGYDDWGRINSTTTQGDLAAVTTTYDNAGRRASVTNARGHKTVYYYDKQGRQIYEILIDPNVDGKVRGEVRETIYSSFSEVSATVTHAARLKQEDFDVLSLIGGLTNDALDARVAALSNASLDNRVSQTYNLRGQIKQAMDALGQKTAYAYNAFGQVSREVRDIDPAGTANARSLTVDYGYNRRGALTSTLRSGSGLASNVLTRSTFDALGRLDKSIDELDITTAYIYHRDSGSGRQVQISGTRGSAYTAYDAVDRVLSLKDLNGNTVTYTHDAVNRKLTLKTSEGFQTVTEYTRHGQVYKVTDAAGATTTYAYDSHGNLLTVTDPLGNVTKNSYDASDNLIQVTQGLTAYDGGSPINDGSATTTKYSFDAANRVLTQTVDPLVDGVGLNLQTRYEYDGQGRKLKITDPRGTVTTQVFNAKGELKDVIVDDVAGGLKLKTTYSYDAQSSVLSITEGAGTAAARKTAYAYDVLGRRISETVDPDQLALKTSYEYDKAGRLLLKRNALDQITARYRYDNAGRMTHSVDALGAVTRYYYDWENRLTGTLAYATPLAADWATLSEASLGTTLAALGTSATDQLSVNAYDRDGRLIYSVNPLGEVTERKYDAVGRVVMLRQYAQTASGVTAGMAPGAIQGKLVANDTLDHITRYAYDKAGNQRFVIDAEGYVNESRYDAAGRVVTTEAHEKRWSGLSGVSELTLSAAYTPARWEFNNGAQGYSGSGGEIEAGRLKMISKPVVGGAWASVDGARSLPIGSILKLDVLPVQYQQHFHVILMDASYAGGRIGVILKPDGKIAAQRQTASKTYVEATIGTYVPGTTYTIELEAFDKGAWIYVYPKGSTRSAGISYRAEEPTLTWQGVRTQLAVHRAPTLAGETFSYVDNLEELPPVQQGRVTHFAYDAAGRPRFALDAEGYVTETRYNDSDARTTTLRYANRVNGGGSYIPASYAPKLSSFTPSMLSGLGGPISTARDLDRAGRLRLETDGNGVQTESTYDAAGRLFQTVQAKGLPEQAVTEYAYDTAGQLTAKTVAKNSTSQAITRYSYDTLGRLQYEFEARAEEITTTNSEWAKAERMRLGYAELLVNLSASQKTALGNLFRTEYGYDGANRRTSIINGTGAIATTGYDSFGNAIKVKDFGGNVSFFYYDRLNRRSLEVDAAGYATSTTYAAASANSAEVVRRHFNKVSATAGVLPTLVESAKDTITRYGYDRLDRITRVEDAGGHVESTTYGVAGSRFNKSVTNKLGGVATFEMDRLGRIIKETLPVTVDGQAVVNVYDYDAHGNRIRSIEGHGLVEARTTSYKYDGEGRLTHRIGQSISVQDGATGATSTATPVDFVRYDALGREVERIERGSWNGSTVSGGRRSLRYYNNAGVVVAEVAPDGAAKRFTVDVAGRVIKEEAFANALHAPSLTVGTLPGFNPDAANDRVTTFEYDTLGRLTARSRLDVTYWESDAQALGPLGINKGTVYLERNAYDANGNLIRQLDAKGSASYFHYDELGRRILSIDRAGYGTSWSYEELSAAATRQTRYAVKLSGYGNQVSAAQTRAYISGIATSVDDRIQTYELDRLGRVKVERTLSVATTSVSEAGSVHASTVAAEIRYQYNGLNQVTEIVRLVDVDALGSQRSATTTIDYDRLGRETHREEPGYLDAQDNYVRPTTDTDYNGYGGVRSVTRRGTTAANDRVTRYEYNGNGDRTAIVDAMGGRTEFALSVQGDIVRQTLRDVRQADGMVRDQVTRFQADAVGRVIWQRDETDTLAVYRTHYNAFGEVAAKGAGADAGIWQETASYNRLGKVERSNSGNGAQKVYIYDRNGNATRQIEGTTSISSLAALSLQDIANSTQLNNVFNAYDERDLLIRSREVKSDFVRDQASLSAAYNEQLTDWFGAIDQTVSGGGQVNGGGVADSGGGIRVDNPPGLDGVASAGITPPPAPTMGGHLQYTGTVPDIVIASPAPAPVPAPPPAPPGNYPQPLNAPLAIRGIAPTATESVKSGSTGSSYQETTFVINLANANPQTQYRVLLVGGPYNGGLVATAYGGGSFAITNSLNQAGHSFDYVIQGYSPYLDRWLEVARANVSASIWPDGYFEYSYEAILTLTAGTQVYVPIHSDLASAATSANVGYFQQWLDSSGPNATNSKYLTVDASYFSQIGQSSVRIDLNGNSGVLASATYAVRGGNGVIAPELELLSLTPAPAPAPVPVPPPPPPAPPTSRPAVYFDGTADAILVDPGLLGAGGGGDFYCAEVGSNDFKYISFANQVPRATSLRNVIGIQDGKTYQFYIRSGTGDINGKLSGGTFTVSGGTPSLSTISSYSMHTPALQFTAPIPPMTVSMTDLRAEVTVNGQLISAAVSNGAFSISWADLSRVLGDDSHLGFRGRAVAYSYKLLGNISGGNTLTLGTVNGSFTIGPQGLTSPVTGVVGGAPAWVRIGKANAGTDVYVNGAANGAPRFYADGNWWMDLSAFAPGQYTISYTDPTSGYVMQAIYAKATASGPATVQQAFRGGLVGTSTPSLYLSSTGLDVNQVSAFRLLEIPAGYAPGTAQFNAEVERARTAGSAMPLSFNASTDLLSWTVSPSAVGKRYAFYYEAQTPEGQTVSGNGSYLVEADGKISGLQFSGGAAPLPSRLTFVFPTTTSLTSSSLKIDGVTINMGGGGGTNFSLDTSVAPISSRPGTYSYAYEARNAEGVLIGKATGSFMVDAFNRITKGPQNVERTPIGSFTFTGPPGRADAAKLYIRTYKNGAAVPAYGAPLVGTWIPPSGDNPGYMRYVWRLPFGDTTFYAKEDFEFELYIADNAGAPLLDETGDGYKVRGVLSVGASATTPITFQRLTGGMNDSAWITHGQTYNGFGEVATEFDDRVLARAQAMVNLYVKSGLWSAGGTLDATAMQTDLRYDTLGRLISKTEAEAFETKANGQVVRTRAVTQYGYDLLGRLTWERDANGNVANRVRYAGDGQDNYLRFAADDGSSVRRTDRLGDLVLVKNELNARTEYAYDKRGHLTEMKRVGVSRTQDFTAGEFIGTVGGALDSQAAVGTTITETYTHDALGQRISHVNAIGGTDRTWYDGLGRIVRTDTAGGSSTKYLYSFVAAGDATDPVLGLGGRNAGGWRLRTEEATGRYRVDETDYFGHTTWKRDLGGHTYNFSYNDAGQLVQQTSSVGQNIVYTYLQNGNVYEIKDISQRLLTRYAYDDAGNRDGESYGRLTSSGTDMLELWQASRIQYDERNRIARVFDNSTGNDAYSANLYKTHDLRYEYDAVGNRRAAIALYWDPINFSRGLLQRDDHWYVYDAANRFTLTKGSLAGARGSATIVRGAQGVSLTYDQAGQRTSALQANGDLERYTYSSDGYLENTYIKMSGQSSETLGARRRVDAAGRSIQYLEYSSGSASLRQSKLSVFDADNRIQRDAVTEGSLGAQSTQYSYYDAGKGAMRESVTTAGSTTTTQTWTYEYWDSAKQATIDSKVNGYVVVNTSTLSYDFNGHLKGVTDSSAGGRYMSYFSDAQGVVLRRSESKEGKTYATFYFYADDRRVGDVSTDPTSRNNRISYAELLAQDPHAKPKDRFKDLQPITSADFDQSYEPINANYPGSAATSYVARTGDTLRSIARSLWGDAAMWYVLADANALSADATLSNGQVLVIPNKVTNIHNNADTFRPYNPGEAIGSIDPTAPTPPPVADKGCGAVGQLIMVVVAVVATIYTAGAAAAYFGVAGAGAGGFAGGWAVLGGSGGLAGAAIAAGASAVGSVASQAVGMAIGQVDSFSWKAVGQAALGGAVTAGVGSQLNSLGVLKAAGGVQGALNAAGRAAIGAGAGMALRGDWSWRNVGISAVSAGVGSAVGNAVSGQSWAQAGNGLGQRLTAGLAGSLTARALTSEQKSNFESVFASTLGNAIGESLASSSQPESGGGTGLRLPRGNKSDWWNKDYSFDTPSASTDYSLTISGAGTNEPFIDSDNWDLQGKSRAVGVAGREAARGAWGIASSLAGDRATNAEVNRIKNQLLALNPELADGVQKGQRYYVPDASTPENLALARSADRQYQAAQASLLAADGMRVGPTIERAQALGIYSGSGDVSLEAGGGGYSQIRNMSAVEGFLTFNSVGRFLNGWGRAATDILTSPYTAVKEAVLMTGDAVGNGTFGALNRLFGGNQRYQNDSALGRSLETNGVSGTIGLATKGAVLSLPGLAQIDALYRNDSYALGASGPGTLLAGAGVVYNKLSNAPVYLTSEGFAALPRVGSIDPRTVRFSQDSASANFRPPHGSVYDFSEGLRIGEINPASIEPIRLVERNGMVFTLDNRRLYAFQEARVDIPYQKLDAIPKRQLFKFTTENNGTSLIIR